MDEFPDIFLRRLEGRVGRIAYQVTRLRFCASPQQDSWAPPINAYRCEKGFVICVDLAGVDRAGLDLQVEPRRMWIRGRRQSPEPGADAGQLLQVLAMEIDHGPFTREVVLPESVLTDEVTAEQRNGLLWISLPVRSPLG